MDKSERRKQKAKKIRLVILVVLFLFVPLAIAGIILALNLNDNLGDGTITSVTVTCGDETWEMQDKADIAFFSRVAQSGSEIDETSTPQEDYRHVILIFHKLKVDLRYELLLSDSVHDCLYLDPKGTLLLIPAELSEQLLVHPRITGVALSFANEPVCSFRTAQGTETPTNAYTGEWTFTKVDGTMTTLTLDSRGEKNATLPADERRGDPLAFTFSIEPDFCSIRVLDAAGTMLYSGDPAKMERLSFKDDTPLTVTVSAEWFEAEGKTYRGKIDYEFDLLYDIPSRSTLFADKAAAGETFEIRIVHSSADSVAVTATFPTGSVTQRRENGELVIRIPVAENTTPNTYSIMLLAADVDETFEVTVLAPEADQT